MEFISLSYGLKAQNRSYRSLFSQQCPKALQKHEEIMKSILDVTGPGNKTRGHFYIDKPNSKCATMVSHRRQLCVALFILTVSIKMIMKENDGKTKVPERKKFGIFPQKP